MEINFDEKLVEEIKNKKCLYDKRSSSYRNTILKAKLWKEIGDKLGVSDEFCQKKWKSLRDRYTRVIKKRNSPAGSAVNIKDEWELMQHLSFLSEVPSSCRSRGNPCFSDDAVNEDSGCTPMFLYKQEEASFTSAEYTQVDTSQPKRRKKSMKLDNIEAIVSSILSKPQEEEGVNQSFGKMIAKLLDDLPEEMQEDARILILSSVTNLRRKARATIPK